VTDEESSKKRNPPGKPVEQGDRTQPVTEANVSKEIASEKPAVKKTKTGGADSKGASKAPKKAAKEAAEDVAEAATADVAKAAPDDVAEAAVKDVAKAAAKDVPKAAMEDVAKAGAAAKVTETVAASQVHSEPPPETQKKESTQRVSKDSEPKPKVERSPQMLEQPQSPAPLEVSPKAEPAQGAGDKPPVSSETKSDDKSKQPESSFAIVESEPVANPPALDVSKDDEYDDEARKDVITSVQKILKPKGNYLTRAEMIEASRQLKRVMPYNYDAWRLHADVLLDALRQLETRQIQPDENFKILAIPLRENDIRDAAEAALRQCAHYASNERRRIALIDEANSVRRLTWF